MTDPSPRQPQPTPPPRIEALATLPVFIRLKGRRAVVAGATEGAAWKAELLAAAGADVLVLADDGAHHFAQLAANPPAGKVTVEARPWRAADLKGARIAIADTEDEYEARAFVDAAHAVGAVANIVDKPEFCDFQFGSLINRSPLVIAISTDGAIPVLGQAIRAKIEALIPPTIARWVQAAQNWRSGISGLGLPLQARRTFWDVIARRALSEPDRMPNEADREDALAAMKGAASTTGRVLLVGAGPGNPDLLTLKALRALQSADLILYDDLVSPAILELARREAERIGVGKRGGGPSCRQDDINRMMVEHAQAGKVVVRLKSGDAAIFGRAGEEIDVCRAAGIAVELVPGISAAQGAAASLTRSLTHRDHARRLQFMTGHAASGKLPDDIEWKAIADPTATTAIYMPKQTLRAFRDRAIHEGLAPDTPAIAIANASCDDEQHRSATIATLPDMLEREPLEGPVLVLIGLALGEPS